MQRADEHAVQGKNNFDHNEDDDRPFQARAAPSVNQAGEGFGDIHESFRFMTKIFVALFELEEQGQLVMQRGRLFVIPGNVRIVEQHDIGKGVETKPQNVGSHAGQTAVRHAELAAAEIVHDRFNAVQQSVNFIFVFFERDGFC